MARPGAFLLGPRRCGPETGRAGRALVFMVVRQEIRVRAKCSDKKQIENKTMKANRILGRLIVGCVFACSLTSKLHAIELGIETDDDNYTRVIHFDTSPGFIYNVEESTNLSDWSLTKAIVATDTNYNYSTTADGMKFYRVVVPDDRISFPGWDDYVEAFLNFNVSTTIQGTYHLELYADGNLLYQITTNVPASGNFGVYDSSYDPSQWPNVADYAIDDWELDVTVTPAVVPMTPGNNGPAQATLKKKQRHPSYPRYGLTVEMPLFNSTVQDEVDMYMVTYLLASLANVSRQYDLAGQQLNEFTDYSAVPKLWGAGEWTQFKSFINNPYLTDLHYFGHGSRQGIGENLSDPTTSILLAEFQNTNRLTHPLKYAALDGCQTASGNHFWQSSEMLKALCGYDKKIDQAEAAASGKWVRFAWGWTTTKQINFAGGNHLNTGHFNFIADFYNHLSDFGPNGVPRYSYDEAFQFALHPNGRGVDQYADDNPDGYFYDYLGCGWALWFD
jgi:hypothetical protein